MPDRQEMRPDTNHTSVLSGLTSDPGPQTTDSSQCFPAASPHGIILHFLLSLKISSASFPSPISEKTLLPDSPRKWKPSKETIPHHIRSRPDVLGLDPHSVFSWVPLLTETSPPCVHGILSPLAYPRLFFIIPPFFLLHHQYSPSFQSAHKHALGSLIGESKKDSSGSSCLSNFHLIFLLPSREVT